MPLTNGQKGLWMLQRLHPNACGYNMPLCFRLTGPFDISVFEKSCWAVFEHHPILTSRIHELKGVPYRQDAPSRFSFAFRELHDTTDDQIDASLEDFRRQPFNLAQDALCRALVISRSAHEHRLLFVIHHIVFDGGSQPVFCQLLFNSYEALLSGRKLNVESAQARFEDFVEWNEQQAKSGIGRGAQKYWMEQLQGSPQTLQIAGASMASREGIDARSRTQRISSETSEYLRAVCARWKIRPAVLFLGAFKILLAERSSTDVVIGMSTNTRPDARYDQVIGFFLNMIALRTRNTPPTLSEDFLRNLQWTLVDGLDHATYPFAQVVRDLKVPRAAAGMPIFRVGYVYLAREVSEPIGGPARTIGALRIEMDRRFRQEGEYEFVLEVSECEDQFEIRFAYDRHQYPMSLVDELAERYLRLLSEPLARELK